MNTIEPNPQKLAQLRGERTLILIKPDGVVRKIIGELLSRFERKGFNIVAMKMVWPDQKLAAAHYTDSEEWLIGTGTRTYEGYLARGVKSKLKPREIGLNTRRKLMEHITAGPVVALVLQGAHVVELARKIRGSTSPLDADVGTVGFDYTIDSYELSDAGDWATKNIIHASDSATNAEKEIKLWFKNDEIFDYETPLDSVTYTKQWQQAHKRQGKSPKS